MSKGQSEFSGLLLASVMTKAKRNYSLILEHDVNVLWDNIAGADPTIFNSCGTVAEANCSRSRLTILNCANWIRTLSGGSGVQALLREILQDKIVVKLKPGDLVVLWSSSLSRRASLPQEVTFVI
ncbi:hypothetical protein [Bradyrhizobium algeriense]|uniref:hypothetical protein n=1 Tax=Bradyrhizobium algeriense TaxID=634784 RepID=UPI0011AE6219|nr:hypothetical protein [Bradyrhizobium algeriense]